MTIKVFGIETGPGGLKIAVIEKGLRSHKPVRFVHRAYAPGDHAAAERELKSLGFDADRDFVAAVFPGFKVTSRNITMPLTQRQQIIEALPYEVESSLPFDAEEIVCDYTEIAATAGETNMLAVIARKDDVAEFLDGLTGIDPDIVIPAPLAAAVGTGAGSGATFETQVLLDNGSLSITFLLNGAPAAMAGASFGAGGGAEAAAREIKRHSLSLAPDGEELSPGRITVCGSLTRSLDAFCSELRSLTGTPVEKTVIPAGDAAVESSGEYQRPDPSTFFAAAYGAALTVADRHAKPRVNLRTGQFKRAQRLTGNRGHTITAAVLLVIGLMVWAGSYISESMALEKEYKSLKNDIRTRFKTALPDVTNIVSESQQMKNEIARLKEKSIALGLGENGRDPFLDYLADITRSVPLKTKLDIEELVYEPGGVTLTGRTVSFEKVEQFKRNIGALKWAKKVTVDRAKVGASKDSVSFRIEVNISI